MLKTYKELKEVDVSKYTHKRDGGEYLNWADCKALLHEHGADEVYFIPLVNEKGSSLFMSDAVFETGTGEKRTNRCYETRIEIHIDDKTYIMHSPVMNGANPVQDNSMTQQRVWNSMCRSFVKGVAIYTGLGFELWQKGEIGETETQDDDLSKHNIFKIKERLQEIYTSKLSNKKMTTKEIATALNKTEDEVKAYFSYFDILNNFERELSKL